MRRRITLADIERRCERIRLDDIVLLLPVKKFSILFWWIECEEIDPLSNTPQYRYTAHVDLKPEIAEWCDATLIGFPTFAETVFDLPDYEATNRPEINFTHVNLHFLSEAEAVLFKLRWF
ncbi:MAG: hypothetical protein EOO77_38240 [Oxalobacteraceae bacterium]|nr:MAG: hypothetical protein EOO77_38240 [Oxalobacteraceae bacterium]